MSNQEFKEETIEREISSYTIFPLYIYSHDDINGTFSAPHHWHEEVEFLYIEQGELLIQLNGVAHHVKAGEVYFINSHDLHQITACSDSTLHHAIVFRPDILKFEWFDTEQSQILMPLIQQQIKFLFQINSQQIILDGIIKEIQEAVKIYHQQNLGWALTVKSCLIKIIATMIRENLFIQVTDSLAQDDHKLLTAKTIMIYIHENYQNKLSIEELAQLANMSPQYFCKFFKTMFGVTAVEYMNAHRIEKACQLLKQTDEKIMTIAFSVGFENFSYFIRKFKALKHITPSEYRKT